MTSLLVALIVHLFNDPSGLMAGTMPFYVVPAKPLGMGSNGEFLELTTSPTYGPTEKKKWQAVLATAGTPKILAELCYRSAYNDIKRGLGGMKVAEAQEFLVKAGGYHVLARASVRTCNISIKKLDVFPLRHPEFKAAEQAIRTQGYLDDVVFLKTCTAAICKEAPQVFAAATVGVPLEAEQ